MKVLYFDCSHGVSGDTALGALLDLGIEAEQLKKELSGLGLTVNFDLAAGKKVLGGIAATQAVINPAVDKGSRYERSMKDVLELVKYSRLSFKVKDISTRVLTEFVLAQAKARNVPMHLLHLGETDAVRTLLYIVGCVICLDMLNIERVYSSTVSDSGAFSEWNHSGEEQEEKFMSIAGLALVKTLSCCFGNMPAIIIDRVGYGMMENGEGSFKLLKVVMGELFGESDAMEEFAYIGNGIENVETLTCSRRPDR